MTSLAIWRMMARLSQRTRRIRDVICVLLVAWAYSRLSENSSRATVEKAIRFSKKLCHKVSHPKLKQYASEFIGDMYEFIHDAQNVRAMEEESAFWNAQALVQKKQKRQR